jgi:general secretion pathway protein J
MSARHHARQSGQWGMTLIEILISLAIIGFMMAMAWSTITNASNARVTFVALEERNHEVRIAMARMVHDVQGAYLSLNEQQQLDNRRTLFIGKSEELRFSTFAHQSLWADANESDQTLVAYYLDSDRSNPGQQALYRKELRRQSNEPWEGEPAEHDILLRGIDKLHFQYWDWEDKKWQDDWDSIKQDAEGGRLPTRVRIELEYKNSRGEELKISTQARILLQERLGTQ